jgi:hypothetical protein
MGFLHIAIAQLHLPAARLALNGADGVCKRKCLRHNDHAERARSTSAEHAPFKMHGLVLCQVWREALDNVTQLRCRESIHQKCACTCTAPADRRGCALPPLRLRTRIQPHEETTNGKVRNATASAIANQ